MERDEKARVSKAREREPQKALQRALGRPPRAREILDGFALGGEPRAEARPP